MKKNIEEIDKLIHEALSKEEAEFYDKLSEEQSILEMTVGVLKGRHKWINLINLVVSFILFGVFIYCIVKFYDAEDTKSMLGWLTFGFLCFSGMMGTKIWYWMEMNKNVMLREIKRLELQISVLSAKTDVEE